MVFELLYSLLYADVDFQAVTVLAKQLVNLRKQKTKTYAIGSRVQAVGTQGKVKFMSYNILSHIFYYVRWGIWNPHLIHDSFGPSEPTTQQHLDRFSRFWATICKTVRPMLSDHCPVCR